MTNKELRELQKLNAMANAIDKVLKCDLSQNTRSELVQLRARLNSDATEIINQSKESEK